MSVRIVCVDEVTASDVPANPAHIAERGCWAGQFLNFQSLVASSRREQRILWNRRSLGQSLAGQLSRQPEELLLASAPSRSGINVKNPQAPSLPVLQRLQHALARGLRHPTNCLPESSGGAWHTLRRCRVRPTSRSQNLENHRGIPAGKDSFPGISRLDLRSGPAALPSFLYRK